MTIRNRVNPDPLARRQRVELMVAARRTAMAAARESRGERFSTKGEAYQAGYRLGYQVALRRLVDRRLKALGIRLSSKQRAGLLRSLE